MQIIFFPLNIQVSQEFLEYTGWGFTVQSTQRVHVKHSQFT